MIPFHVLSSISFHIRRTAARISITCNLVRQYTIFSAGTWFGHVEMTKLLDGVPAQLFCKSYLNQMSSKHGLV